MCFGSSSPPPAPDPKETSQAQFAANVGTALAQQQINFVDQTTPTGSLTFSPTGQNLSLTGPDGSVITAPKYESTVSLTPEQQAIFNQQQANTLQGSQLGGQLLSGIGSLMDKPFIPNFDAQAFLAQNPEAARALSYTGPTYNSGLQHFVQTGANEGRLTGWDEAGYLAQNQDVADMLGRTAPSGGVDANYYLTQNQDVLRNAALNLDPAIAKRFTDFAQQHYQNYGTNENRPGAPAAGTQVPVKATLNPDDGRYYDAAGHWVPNYDPANPPMTGSPGGTFDPMGYLSQNQDVLSEAYKSIYGVALPGQLDQLDPSLLGGLQTAAQQHWSQYGRAEGRQGWDAPQYESALDHFLRTGAAEGRKGGFDEAAYLGAYDDVQNAVNRGSARNAEQYYQMFGGEGGVPGMPSTGLPGPQTSLQTTFGNYWNPQTGPQVQTSLDPFSAIQMGVGNAGSVQTSLDPFSAIQMGLGNAGPIQGQIGQTQGGVSYGSPLQSQIAQYLFQMGFSPGGAINQNINWSGLPGGAQQINIPGLGNVQMPGAPQVSSGISTGGYGNVQMPDAPQVSSGISTGGYGQVDAPEGTPVQTSAGNVPLSSTFGDAGALLRMLGPAAAIQFGIDPRQLQTSLAGYGLGQVQTSLGDQSQFPQSTGTLGAGWDIQRGVDLSGLAGIPGQDDFSADRARVEEALFSRLDPQFQRDRSALESRLANQGIGIGTEAYDRAVDEWNRAQTDARMQTVLAGGQEQSRLFDLSLRGRQQGANELFGQGQFANAAQQQGFEQLLARGQFQNQAAQDVFSRALASGQFANAAQAQQFGQALAQGQFGNEALMNMFGQDIARGQFGNQAQAQQFSQMLAGGQFQNEAQQQAYNQALGRGQFANQAGMDTFQQMLSNAGLANQAADISGRLGIERGRLGLEGQDLRLRANLGNAGIQNDAARIMSDYGINAGRLGLEGQDLQLRANLGSAGIQNDAARIMSDYGINAGRLGMEGQRLALDQAQANADIQQQNWLNAFNQAVKGADYSLGAQSQQFGQNQTLADFYNQAAQGQFNQGLQAGQFANQATIDQTGMWNTAQAQDFGQRAAQQAAAAAAQKQYFDQLLASGEFANTAQAQEAQQAAARFAAENAAQKQYFDQLLASGDFANQAQAQEAQQAAARFAAENLAQNQAYLQGTGLQDQQFMQLLSALQASNQGQQQAWQQGMSERQQGIQEQAMQYTMPVNIAAALMGMNGVQMPQFGGIPQVGVAPTDVTGPLNTQYQNQMAGWQQQNSADSGTMSALAGLAGAAMIAFSDARAKQNIRFVGKHPAGHNLYQFQYRWGGPEQIGVLAQEVERTHPEAVLDLGGLKIVDYGKL